MELGVERRRRSTRAAARRCRRGCTSRARRGASPRGWATTYSSVDSCTTFWIGRAPARPPHWDDARAHLDRRGVQADVLVVHRRVERAPVVPALGHVRTGRLAGVAEAVRARRRVALGAPVVDRPRDLLADRVQRRLVEVDPRLVPLQPQVVLDARVVRLGRRLDQGRRHVAVQVEHLGGEPLLHQAHRVARLGLGLREVVAVEVEPVAVGARARHAAVGVLDHVEDQDRVAEDLVDHRVLAVRRGGELLDRVDHRVHALVLVAVDAALGEDRDLDVVAEPAQEPLRGGGVLEHQRAHAEPAEVVAPLLAGAEPVDDDAEHVAAGRGLADHLQLHAAAAAVLDVLERAADRVVRDVREAAGRIHGIGAVGQVLCGVRLRRAAPRGFGRGRAGHRPGGEHEYEQQQRPTEPARHQQSPSSRRASIPPAPISCPDSYSQA